MYQVNKPQFWKDRIEAAKKRGHKHWSVYITRDSDWVFLNEEHRKIFDMEIKATDKVLDAGCGYGRWAKYFNPENYTGVDLSPDFIEIAKAENPGYKFEVGHLEALNYYNKQFDVAFCVSIKEMVINNVGQELWDAMQTELKRVAKRLLILEYTNPAEYEAV